MIESQIKGRGIQDEDVLRAMETVERHQFVPPEYAAQAYDDRPLPIGYGQTISQPYIVAVMSELLHLRSDSRVLEVGTGSGYQAAILAEIVQAVYTVEIVPELCQAARERLARLGYDRVQVLCGDGYLGWPECAPYDAIIVTCAPDHIPQPLVDQLVDGGRMVIPVGPSGAFQTLWLVQRKGAEILSSQIMGVAFVPLTGKHERRALTITQPGGSTPRG
jgi:protein-L-isoaspartate(D-aspartate) O-methyltransferase